MQQLLIFVPNHHHLQRSPILKMTVERVEPKWIEMFCIPPLSLWNHKQAEFKQASWSSCKSKTTKTISRSNNISLFYKKIVFKTTLENMVDHHQGNLITLREYANSGHELVQTCIPGEANKHSGNEKCCN